MGNAAMKRVPEDLTKCSEKQLQSMINSVIINNPWSEDEKCSAEDSLAMTIEIMREQGLRPITPKEYIAEIKHQRKTNPNSNYGVRVWLPIDNFRCSTPPDKITKENPCFGASDRKEYPDHKAMHKTDSSSLHTTDSARYSAFSHADGKMSETYSQDSIVSLQLPSSRDQAVSEIVKSGASDAILSELSYGDGTDNEDVLTEEWPTHGSNLKYHLQQQQFA